MSFNKTLWKPSADVKAAIEKGNRRMRRRNYIRTMLTGSTPRPAAPVKPR